MKTKRKNPAVEAILFSKSINNLHDELREDFFFCIHKKPAKMMSQLSHSFTLFSKVLSFPLFSLVRSGQSQYLTLQMGKNCHDTLES